MNDLTIHQQLKLNWQAVQDDVRQAAADSGRDASSIRVIGVSKYVDADTTLALVQAGCKELGESRPQTLWQKADTLKLDSSVCWHLIGHLQRNKVRRTIRHHAVIHSVDSVRLMQAVAEEAASQNQQASVLLEVNISGDAAKTGFVPTDLMGVLQQMPAAGVRVLGLMAMAGWGTDPSDAKRQFDQTRQLRDQLERQSGHALPELSMGMSGDFREAISAGATMIRIGSRLFEGVIDRN